MARRRSRGHRRRGARTPWHAALRGAPTSKHWPPECRQPGGLASPQPTLPKVTEDVLRRSFWLALATGAAVAVPASAGTVRGVLWLTPPSPRAAAESGGNRRAPQ